jgi:D-3-phosphoglycerate dehydrogenase / 2-oxoglutarate reductase
MPEFRYRMLMDTHDWDSIETEKNILEQVGCQVIPLIFSSDQELLAAIRDADALLPRYVNIQRHHIQHMSHCKIIARSGIGVDIVDVEAATEQGIWVTNVPDYCAEEVAGHAVSLILACARKLTLYRQDVQKGVWKWQSGKSINRLSQSTFGLIGFGKIGRLVWQRMKAFGCQGLIYDPYIPVDTVVKLGAQSVGLDVLLSTADMIHIQSPLTPDTYHLISKREFGLMKPGMILTNTARGPIIDEAAFLEALRSGRVAAAGLDDLEEEPAKTRDWQPSNPIMHLPNVIVTPHAAWYSEQSAEDVKRISATEIARVLTGQKPLYPVNEPKQRGN